MIDPGNDRAAGCNDDLGVVGCASAADSGSAERIAEGNPSARAAVGCRTIISDANVAAVPLNSVQATMGLPAASRPQSLAAASRQP